MLIHLKAIVSAAQKELHLANFNLIEEAPPGDVRHMTAPSHVAGKLGREYKKKSKVMIPKNCRIHYPPNVDNESHVDETGWFVQVLVPTNEYRCRLGRCSRSRPLVLD